MARQNALSITTNGTTKDALAEAYGQVIDAIQRVTIAEQIKNKNYSGDPQTGTVEINRFNNATISNYGTARTAGNGSGIINSGKVVISINTDKEIVEEIEEKDIKLYSTKDLVARRANNYVQRISAFLDTEFFAEAVSTGTAVTNSAGLTTIAEKLEELIVSVETVSNNYVDGVSRDELVLCVKPSVYSQILNYIDKVPNLITGLDEYKFHGIRIFSNHRQTKDAICMREGSVAQLVLISPFKLDPIPLSEAYGLEMFIHKGTKAVTPDLIKYVASI